MQTLLKAYRAGWLILLVGMTGCATPPQPIPVAVDCLKYPTPPAPLMMPPAISDFSKYYAPLTVKQPN